MTATGYAIYRPPRQQVDSVLSQANPVSAIPYNVLPLTRNVKIISIGTVITWAVTQPNPMQIIVTVDGITITYTVTNPVSATYYYPKLDERNTAATQGSTATGQEFGSFLAYLNSSGRSVRVDVAVTWAITQPTPLAARVKWAKW